ncbi:MAG: histidine kinase [Rhodospirillaceae bacterium]|nr:histidine kinase [Rhodospirillaceae bacterium]
MTDPAAPAPSEAQSRPLVDRAVALNTILGFWAFYFVINTLRMAMAGAEDQLDLMGRRAMVVVAGIALTLVLWLVLRRLEGRSMRVLVTAAFVAAIPVAVAYAIFNYAAFYIVEPLESVLREIEQYEAQNKSAWVMIADSAFSWYFFIAAWGVLYVALAYAAKVGQAERAAAAYRAEAQDAQLRALRYQINPHFLFNTLNSLSTLVLQKRTDEADRMIVNLSTFFRTSLTSDPAADISLSDEIRMQRLYLDIEQVRFPERLVARIDVPEQLWDARVPGLILQPIVENAIKYGVARTTAPVTIAISARAEGDDLRLTVEDNAGGAASPKPGAGVGLVNVRDRLAARFNGQARCEFGPRAGGGFRVDLTMPLRRDAA